MFLFLRFIVMILEYDNLAKITLSLTLNFQNFPQQQHYNLGTFSAEQAENVPLFG